MPSLGLGRLALRCWLEQDEIRPMMQIKSADFPTRRCMWNAPNPPAIARSIRQVGFGGKTLRAFEAKVLSGYSIRPVFPFGAVAQLGEHHVCNVGVAGSSPVGSISFLDSALYFRWRMTKPEIRMTKECRSPNGE